MENGGITLGIFSISKKLLSSNYVLTLLKFFIFKFFFNLFLNDAATVEIMERQTVGSVSSHIITDYF